MIKLKIFKAEFTESKVAFKKVAFLGKWLKPLSSTYKRIALMFELFSRKESIEMLDVMSDQQKCSPVYILVVCL